MKQEIQEEVLTDTVIDLGTARRGEIDESFLVQFGSMIKMIMKRMFGSEKKSFMQYVDPSFGGSYQSPIKIRGTKSEINSFANVLSGEKDYMSALKEYGLMDPKTYDSKYKLDRAVHRFEKKTGLKWPLK